jgi:hypothetical protein
MNEKLPAPCDKCAGTGLFEGADCERCRGKGYLIINDGQTRGQNTSAKEPRSRAGARPPKSKQQPEAMIERFLSAVARSKHPDLYAGFVAVTLAKFLTNCVQVVVVSITG